MQHEQSEETQGAFQESPEIHPRGNDLYDSETEGDDALSDSQLTERTTATERRPEHDEDRRVPVMVCDRCHGVPTNVCVENGEVRCPSCAGPGHRVCEQLTRMQSLVLSRASEAERLLSVFCRSANDDSLRVKEYLDREEHGQSGGVRRQLEAVIAAVAELETGVLAMSGLAAEGPRDGGWSPEVAGTLTDTCVAWIRRRLEVARTEATTTRKRRAPRPDDSSPAQRRRSA